MVSSSFGGFSQVEKVDTQTIQKELNCDTFYVLGQNTKRYRVKSEQRRPNNATSGYILSRKVLVSIAFDEGWRESSGFGPEVSVIMCQVDDTSCPSTKKIPKSAEMPGRTINRDLINIRIAYVGLWSGSFCNIPLAFARSFVGRYRERGRVNDHGLRRRDRHQTSIDDSRGEIESFSNFG